jgi:hypothetical protein
MKRVAIILGCLLSLGTVVFGQDYPKIEIPIGYSYMHFNPENSNVVSGFSLNGGGGGVAVYIDDWIGIQAEFEGYGSATKTFAFSGSNSFCPSGCTVTANGSLFTYDVGPIFKYRSEHFETFIETLVGGAHSDVYGNLLKACALACVTTKSVDNNAWSFIVGGGFDIPVSKAIAIRPAQFDFELTRFDSAFTNSNHNQSNFRYQAGVIIRF